MYTFPSNFPPERVHPDAPLSPPAPPRAAQVWPDTDHSALLKLRTGTAAEQDATLRQLFVAYALPLRRYIRQHWPLLPEADIDDYASEFTTLCLTGEKAHFLTYDPEREGPRARLRTYLCRILDHYLSNQHRRAHAQIRGGHRSFESLDTTNPAAHQELPVDCNQPPGVDIDAYDRHWAQHVLSLAFSALEVGNETTRAALPLLRPWILADPGEVTLKETAKTLGRTHAALRAQLHRHRKEWRLAVRQAVAQTVSHPEDIDDELRHLAAVLSRHPME
jgi:DNA-directed RNA polymerase specialized sigma24 family protein